MRSYNSSICSLDNFSCTSCPVTPVRIDFLPVIFVLIDWLSGSSVWDMLLSGPYSFQKFDIAFEFEFESSFFLTCTSGFTLATKGYL